MKFFQNKNNVEQLEQLIKECAAGDLEAVKKLLEMNKEIINAIGKNGNTPLCQAALNGHFEIVKELIDNKADPFIKNEQEQTALLIARRLDYFEIRKLLEKYELDVRTGGKAEEY